MAIDNAIRDCEQRPSSKTVTEARKEADACDECESNTMDLVPATKQKESAIRHICTVMWASMRSTKWMKTSQTQHANCMRSNEPIERIKHQWRRKQILGTQQLAPSISATWRQKQVQCVWCGYLRKEGGALSAPWKPIDERWFELRREPPSKSSAGKPAAVLQYSGHNLLEKRLVVLSARREQRREASGRAVVSLAVAGRPARLRLTSANGYEADALVSRIASILSSSRLA